MYHRLEIFYSGRVERKLYLLINLRFCYQSLPGSDIDKHLVSLSAQQTSERYVYGNNLLLNLLLLRETSKTLYLISTF